MELVDWSRGVGKPEGPRASPEATTAVRVLPHNVQLVVKPAAAVVVAYAVQTKHLPDGR